MPGGILVTLGFPGGSDGKESACSVGDSDSTPESGRSPGEGKGNPLQYSFPENPTDTHTHTHTHTHTQALGGTLGGHKELGTTE